MNQKLQHGIFDDNNKSSRRKASFALKQNLIEWLDSINMKQYAPNLIDMGFDDLDILKQMMRSDIPLTHEILLNSGISKPGHRARILVKLEWDAGLFMENESLKTAIASIK